MSNQEEDFSGMSYSFSLFLKKVGEGKITKKNIKKVIMWRVTDDPIKSEENLIEMKENWMKLQNLLLKPLYEETLRQRGLPRKSQSNRVDMKKTYSIDELTKVLKVSR